MPQSHDCGFSVWVIPTCQDYVNEIGTSARVPIGRET